MGNLIYLFPAITKINLGTNNKGGFQNLKPFASDYDGYDQLMAGDEWEGGKSKNPVVPHFK